MSDDTTLQNQNSQTPPPEPNKDSMVTAEMRLRAQMAMEGEERRKRREETIRQEQEAIEKAKQEEELKKREAFEQAKIAQEKIEQEARQKEERERVSQQLKQQIDEVRASGGGLKTIRTLKIDQEDLIKGQNLSVVGIAIKEEEKRRRIAESQEVGSSKNKPLLIASLVLILLATGIVLYLYNAYYSTTPLGILPGKSEVVQSIIFADMNRSLDITSITYDDLINRIKNEIRNPPDLRLGAIENYVLNKRNSDNILATISAEDFIKSVGGNAPDDFLRTLDKEYMFGVLSSAENAAFLIIKTESYEQGLAGMLTWENTSLTKDMYQILTSLKPEDELLTKPYEDMLIKNVDTRTLLDKEGVPRLIYGFLDGERTIVLAGSKQAFIETLNRFNTPKPLSN